jgi:hypothetical protein
VERLAAVEQPLRVADGLLRGEDQVVRDPLDAHRPPRQRPAGGVARTSVASAAGGVAITVRYGERGGVGHIATVPRRARRA